MKRETIIQAIREIKPELRTMGVMNLWLFGSLARGETAAHDADLLVEFSDRATLTGFMNLKFFLEDKLGLAVDLHTRSSCPDRFMRRIQPELLHVA
ncbi:MAG: DNA polymerase subunit beta [Verrucomicrobia bacterium]|nr:MAG: DNA polymerase subunit beta [Verrucomicrobiota bacterium]TAF25891.1 MAG: DNA polymerase subunit beta [Verrucomicrobiota bacterium]